MFRMTTLCLASDLPRGVGKAWRRRGRRLFGSMPPNSTALCLSEDQPFRITKRENQRLSLQIFPRLEAIVKRSGRDAAGLSMNSIEKSLKNNGRSSLAAEPVSPDLAVILASLQTMRAGDFSVRLPGSWTGLAGKIADTFNEIVSVNQQMAQELNRVGQVVGKEGKTRERTRFHESKGAWGEMEVSINTLIEDLLRPTAEVTRAIAGVAQGNLTQTVRLDVDGRPLEGEFLRSAKIVNTMIQQLGVFTSEVTRVAREVGADGKLGGQAKVRGASGVWK